MGLDLFFIGIMALIGILWYICIPWAFNTKRLADVVCKLCSEYGSREYIDIYTNNRIKKTLYKYTILTAILTFIKQAIMVIPTITAIVLFYMANICVIEIIIAKIGVALMIILTLVFTLLQIPSMSLTFDRLLYLISLSPDDYLLKLLIINTSPLIIWITIFTVLIIFKY